MTPRAATCRYLLAGRFHTLAWAEWGPEGGAPVLCVHGLTRQGRDFDALAMALAAEGRRVLCPDLPGRGASGWLPDAALYQPPSYVAALAHLLARLDGPVDWVGTSLGGICGMIAAAMPGNPIRRLVLNDVGARIPAAALARIGAYLGAAPPVFPDLAAVEAHLARVHAPFGAWTDFAQLARHSVRAVPGGLALHYDPAIAAPFNAAPPADMDLSPLWEAGTAPALVIRGAESDLLPEGDFRAMGGKPGTSLLEIPGCGHAPSLQSAAEIGPILGFLRG